MMAKPKPHRYPPFEHNFDDLCDAGCGRPVPEHGSSRYLEQLGWVVHENEIYEDGWERICPVCYPATLSATREVAMLIDNSERLVSDSQIATSENTPEIT